MKVRIVERRIDLAPGLRQSMKEELQVVGATYGLRTLTLTLSADGQLHRSELRSRGKNIDFKVEAEASELETAFRDSLDRLMEMSERAVVPKKGHWARKSVRKDVPEMPDFC